MTDKIPIDHHDVAPGDPEEAEHIQHPRQEAGQDESIAERLEKHPDSVEAQLDNALDASMDASDPPAATQPVHHHRPPSSSGYDAKAEALLKKG